MKKWCFTAGWQLWLFLVQNAWIKPQAEFEIRKTIKWETRSEMIIWWNGVPFIVILDLVAANPVAFICSGLTAVYIHCEICRCQSCTDNAETFTLLNKCKIRYKFICRSYETSWKSERLWHICCQRLWPKWYKMYNLRLIRFTTVGQIYLLSWIWNIVIFCIIWYPITHKYST